ncbi:MAG: helix-turn-helix domain-containing protein [Chthoniobacterales bacterium]|nr:helix-turn-helix domain-containing protein [Chthoniobacterales bacterium]
MLTAPLPDVAATTAEDFFTTTQGRVYARALDARDARFDGVFFVGITTTRIYCRPVCPARVAYHSHRRFFAAAAAAEQAGYRPCLRCRPELAPGRGSCDSVSRIAGAAEHRIAAGALNGHSVTDLARELHVSERHLRRALERELGVSPLKLAQSHRLLFAKRLLADTKLPITQIAYASGFQSLRRFNASFAEQYRMPPSAVRRAPGAKNTPASRAQRPDEMLRLTLAYRAPLAWDVLLDCLAGDAIGGVEVIEGRRYGRTVEIDGHTGVMFAEDASAASAPSDKTHVNVDVSASLVPALMPLLSRLRHLFDLDAQPSAIDEHLSQGGLEALVAAHPGLRVPGAIDGFDIALRTLLRGRARPCRAQMIDASGAQSDDVAVRVTWAIGEPLETGVPGLSRLSPTAWRVVDAGVERLVSLGVMRGRADAAVAVAKLVAGGTLRLEPGGDVAAVRAALAAIRGVGDQVAAKLVSRALRWPDALSPGETALQRAAKARSSSALMAMAQRWRPWGSYAALHLRLHDEAQQSSLTARARRGATPDLNSQEDESCRMHAHASMAS